MVKHLSHRFEMRLAYTADIEQHRIAEWDADCIVDLWWHGTLHYQWGRKTVKQISSHRWTQLKWGRLKPSRLLQLYADDVGAIVVPSLRLLRIMQDVETGPRQLPRDIRLAQKGFDPSLLEDYDLRAGPLEVGWAGASEAKDKHVDDLIAAWPTIRLADKCLTYGEMGDFYNGVDVIAISSADEGDPRPLIEGMACGCFPVATDVGIVPELVRHGENGLIVSERSPEAFREAIDWCAANIGHVRAAGRENARVMRATRTWAHVMPQWGDVIDAAIARSKIPVAEPDIQLSL